MVEVLHEFAGDRKHPRAGKMESPQSEEERMFYDFERLTGL